MKTNKLIILALLTLAATGCGQATKNDAATTENVAMAAVDTNATVKRTIKYFFQANGGSCLFFDDGTAFVCARCELVEQNRADLEQYKPNSTYKEFPTWTIGHIPVFV
jgi:hypothetical protein